MRYDVGVLGDLFERLPGAPRRGVLALAALVEARRFFPDVPSLGEIAAGGGDGCGRLVAKIGVPVPGQLDGVTRRLAAELGSVDWDAIEDPAGRVLQEFRASADRKRQGAFFTPAAVVEQVLEAVPGLERGARVLDPACGSGAFLLGAARRGALIYGVDLDPEAVEVARFRLALRATPGRPPILVAGDLLSSPGVVGSDLDAVIGNPPYVRFHGMSKSDRARLGRNFETAAGQFDLFAPFLEDALRRVRIGGHVAFVLPALLLRGARYASLRRFLLARARMKCVIDHGDGAFPGVLAPTCVLVLERTGAGGSTGEAGKPPRGSPSPDVPPGERRRAALGPAGRTARASASVRWIYPVAARAARARLRTARVDERIWRRDPEAAFAPVRRTEQSLLGRLDRFPTLARIAHLGRGLEIGRKSPALSASGAGVGCLTGSDVERFRFDLRRCVDPRALPARLAPLHDDLLARVLVRETGARLTAVRVETGIASTRSLFHVRPHDPAFPHAYLVGYLNSALAQWWYATRIRAASEIFPKLRIGQLGTLHVPDEPALIRKVAALATKRERLPTNSPEALALEAAIDAAFTQALQLPPAEAALIR